MVAPVCAPYQALSPPPSPRSPSPSSSTSGRSFYSLPFKLLIHPPSPSLPACCPSLSLSLTTWYPEPFFIYSMRHSPPFPLLLLLFAQMLYLPRPSSPPYVGGVAAPHKDVFGRELCAVFVGDKGRLGCVRDKKA